MTERWAPCPQCKGQGFVLKKANEEDCIRCQGTGFYQCVMEFMEDQNRFENETWLRWKDER